MRKPLERWTDYFVEREREGGNTGSRSRSEVEVEVEKLSVALSRSWSLCKKTILIVCALKEYNLLDVA